MERAVASTLGSGDANGHSRRSELCERCETAAVAIAAIGDAPEVVYLAAIELIDRLFMGRPGRKATVTWALVRLSVGKCI